MVQTANTMWGLWPEVGGSSDNKGLLVCNMGSSVVCLFHFPPPPPTHTHQTHWLGSSMAPALQGWAWKVKKMIISAPALTAHKLLGPSLCLEMQSRAAGGSSEGTLVQPPLASHSHYQWSPWPCLQSRGRVAETLLANRLRVTVHNWPTDTGH